MYKFLSNVVDPNSNIIQAKLQTPTGNEIVELDMWPVDKYHRMSTSTLTEAEYDALPNIDTDLDSTVLMFVKENYGMFGQLNTNNPS